MNRELRQFFFMTMLTLVLAGNGSGLAVQAGVEEPVVEKETNSMGGSKEAQELYLRVGEKKTKGGLRIEVMRIVADSRCPEGTSCYWPGILVAELKVGDGLDEQNVLIGNRGGKPVLVEAPFDPKKVDYVEGGTRVEDWIFRLVKTEPTRVNKKPISRANYRLMIRYGDSAREKSVIGTATMSVDKTIIMDLRAEGADSTVGHSRLVYPVGHAQYETILNHLGGLKPGEHKLVRPFPEERSHGLR